MSDPLPIAGSLRRDTRIGIIHFMAFPEVMQGEGPIVETLCQILRDDYFDAVEVTRVRDAGVAREVARLLAASQMAVSFGAHPVLLGGKLNLNSLDQAERSRAVEAVSACFEQAAAFGATSVTVLSGRWQKGTEQETEVVLIDSLVTLATRAAAGNLQLALEVFDDDVDKCSYVGKWPVAERVGRTVKETCPNFHLVHDQAHLAVLGETAAVSLPPLKDLLLQVHLGNAILLDPKHAAYGDNHPHFGAIGGVVSVTEVAEFLKALYAIGYLGSDARKTLSFEIKPLPGEASDLLITNAKRTLNSAASQLGLWV